MIKKIKQWLYTRFLEVWIKDMLLTENQALRRKIDELQAELAEKNAYIDGLTTGIRAIRRVVVNTQPQQKM